MCLGKQCRPRSDCFWRSSLIRVSTVCHSVCIVWTHYSMVEPHSSNLRVITAIFLGVRIFRKFTVVQFYKSRMPEQFTPARAPDKLLFGVKYSIILSKNQLSFKRLGTITQLIDRVPYLFLISGVNLKTFLVRKACRSLISEIKGVLYALALNKFFHFLLRLLWEFWDFTIN